LVPPPICNARAKPVVARVQLYRDVNGELSVPSSNSNTGSNSSTGRSSSHTPRPPRHVQNETITTTTTTTTTTTSSAEKDATVDVKNNNIDDDAVAASSGIGDIMHRRSSTSGQRQSSSSSSSTTPFLPRDGLVTSERHTLQATFGISHPLDRMAVTANGNLQRLFSSYYDAPVTVVLDYCRPANNSTTTATSKTANFTNSDNDSLISSSLSTLATTTCTTTKIWDRRVHLRVHNVTFCTAVSTVHVHDVQCQELVESGQVGIGQLYRYLDILPDFELHQAGYHPTQQQQQQQGDKEEANGSGGVSALWRNYTLSCPRYVTCHIQETFIPGAWDIRVPSTTTTKTTSTTFNPPKPPPLEHF
jgi:chorismate-pyruvate lyase